MKTRASFEVAYWEGQAWHAVLLLPEHTQWPGLKQQCTGIVKACRKCGWYVQGELFRSKPSAVDVTADALKHLTKNNQNFMTVFWSHRLAAKCSIGQQAGAASTAMHGMVCSTSGAIIKVIKCAKVVLHSSNIASRIISCDVCTLCGKFLLTSATLSSAWTTEVVGKVFIQ